jgi:hypothetical protein
MRIILATIKKRCSNFKVNFSMFLDINICFLIISCLNLEPKDEGYNCIRFTSTHLRDKVTLSHHLAPPTLSSPHTAQIEKSCSSPFLCVYKPNTLQNNKDRALFLKVFRKKPVSPMRKPFPLSISI